MQRGAPRSPAQRDLRAGLTTCAWCCADGGACSCSLVGSLFPPSDPVSRGHGARLHVVCMRRHIVLQSGGGRESRMRMRRVGHLHLPRSAFSPYSFSTVLLSTIISNINIIYTNTQRQRSKHRKKENRANTEREDTLEERGSQLGDGARAVQRGHNMARPACGLPAAG